jgi:hypothetical protein
MHYHEDHGLGLLGQAEKTAASGLSCAQYGACRTQCRYRLEIPVAMRAYMYAYGYRRPALAKSVLEPHDKARLHCRKCTSCAAFYLMGFAVPKKVQDIIRVLDVPFEFLKG